MATTQTRGQNQDNILLESAKLEYSKDNGNTFIDVGLADGVSITFGSTDRDVQPGNGPPPDIVKGSASQTATISADLWELSLQMLEDLTGGLFTKGTVAGTEKIGHTQILKKQIANDFIAFDLQMYNGNKPTAISVADSTPTTYVLDTDYRVIKVGEIWGVQWIDGASFSDTKDITITYTVTPASEEYASVGGSSTKEAFRLKVTQIIPRNDVDYDIKNIWEFYRCFQSGDLVMALKNKDETDPVARIPLTISCELDPTRVIGEQLMTFRRLKVSHT